MDISFTFENNLDPADIQLNGNGGLKSDKELETSIIISLFTDRLAEKDDPIESDDRRGWWGDSFSRVEGDRIGSRLWELAREKQTIHTLNRAQEFCQEALAWIVEDGIAESVEVECEWIMLGILRIKIEVTESSLEVEKFQFNFVWNQLREK